MDPSPAPRYRRLLEEHGHDTAEVPDKKVIHAFLREDLLNARQLTSEEAARIWARLSGGRSAEAEG